MSESTGATMNPIDRAIEALEKALEREIQDYPATTEGFIEEALQALRDKEFVCVLREPTDEVLMTVERSHWNELISAAQPKE